MASHVDDDALYLLPAYGRRYWTGASALKAWEEGRDFLILHGPYCSSRDLAKIRFDGYHRLIFLNIRHVEIARLELTSEASDVAPT